MCQASAVTSECPHIPACHLSSQGLTSKQRDKQTADQRCTMWFEGKEHHFGRQVELCACPDSATSQQHILVFSCCTISHHEQHLALLHQFLGTNEDAS